MKKIILLAVFLSPLLVYGQNPFPKDESGNINFTFIVENNLNAKTLFRNAKSWIATSSLSTESRTYKPKISMEDQSTGRIIVDYEYYKYLPGSGLSESMTVSSSFRITFDFKDKKYRFKIEDYIDVLKYGNKEYVKTFYTLHDDYEKNENVSFVLKIKKFFIDISDSIQKSMSISDDF